MKKVLFICALLTASSTLFAQKYAVIDANTKLTEACRDSRNIDYRLVNQAWRDIQECMVNEKTGEPMTAHTTNPVPFILVNYDEDYTLDDCKGGLCDIIPTLMDIMGLDKPAEMTGKSLLVRK